MPRKQSRRTKKGSGGRMGTNADNAVTIVTPIERFEQRLAQSADATVLRGKLIFSTTIVSTTPTVILTLSANAFGTRSIAFAANFTQWKIKRLLMKFTGIVGAANVGAAAGVFDDVSSSTDVPTTLSDVAQLRCSALSPPGSTIPCFFEYKPNDSKLWHFTTSDSGDSRLITYGVLYAVAVSGSSAAFFAEVDYELVYKGAADVS